MSLKIEGETLISDEEVNVKLDEAYQKYKQMKKDAYELRLTYQEALAQAKASKNKSDAVKVL